MSTTSKHPGEFVREKYLAPKKLTVTEAARLIGVSRPGVSAFINGRVNTTAHMAARIESAFGVQAQVLLDMQAAYDAANTETNKIATETLQYVPPFLGIKSNDIIAWADHNIAARSRLAVLLRTLANSTSDFSEIDFPGNDDSERPGWDGFTDSPTGSRWVPAGKAGWEFGVTGNIKSKADGDFAKSVKAYKTQAERNEVTFVFVTPNRWAGKDDWVTEMLAKKKWRGVRAYDASDLEQWFAQSPSAQAWFSNETNRPTQGVLSLDKAWSDWADVATPPLSPQLFETAIEVGSKPLSEFLSNQSAGPLTIVADSTGEALAFLAQVFARPDFAQHRDRALVFDEPGTFPRLAQGTQPFIAITHNRDVEREFGPAPKHIRTIVVYPRNTTNDEPGITLEPVGYEVFRKALESMGKTEDDIKRLTNESGRSLTVLRRRLAQYEAIRTPQWATSDGQSRLLVPLALAGTWIANNEADQVALGYLAAADYEEVERNVGQLLRLNDSPLWSIGRHRGVISKIDALFAIAPAVTAADLEHFRQLAEVVLGEDDPSLDLTVEERWAAESHGKRRDFSASLRTGVSETLVLLAVHGKQLFGPRLGYDGQLVANQFVQKLLTPLTTRKLEANDRDLSTYAEAAPDIFLKILEQDLKGDIPEAYGLLKPVNTGMFGFPSHRSGLLWALEGLAWSKETFLRTVLVLGNLAQVEINDNLSNKPIASLQSIFRAWMPQTSAGHTERVKAIEVLFARYPAVAWKICLDQFAKRGGDVGNYSHKPRWRPDGYGFGQPFATHGPRLQFQKDMVELALSRPVYTASMIRDLVDSLHALGKEYQNIVWDLVGSWAASGQSPADVNGVREAIRTRVLSRRARRGEDEATLTKKAREVYASLEPSDAINKHEWLFRQAWVEESADELNEDEHDYRKREARIEAQRVEALRAIVVAHGIDGVFALSKLGTAQRQIGFHLAKSVLDDETARTFICRALREDGNQISPESRGLIGGALIGLGDQGRAAFLAFSVTTLTEAETVSLLMLAPYERATWSVADQLTYVGRDSYWQNVIPDWVFSDQESDNNESVERLLKAKRPRAAFAAAHLKLEVIRPDLILKMLSEMLVGGNDKAGEYQLREYDIRRAFDIIDRTPDITLEQKASLELGYIESLARMLGSDHERGIPNLEKYIAQHPDMFVQALVWAYKREDQGEDPEDIRLPEGRSDLAERGFRLLDGLQRIPGSEDSDIEQQRAKLTAWVDAVRSASRDVSRLDICDLCLGKLFAHAPADADGIWPTEPVRDVMEEIQTESLFSGAHTGLYNSRGVVWRGEGGGQERELAAKYKVWAEALQFSHPAVSASLLMDMVRTYEREAEQHDTEAGIRRRLRH